MYSKCKWSALAGVLVLLWGCGGSEKSGTPSSGGTENGIGTCQLSGGATAKLPVKVLAGVDPNANEDHVFTIFSTTDKQDSDLVVGGFLLKGAAFTVGRAYTLTDGGEKTGLVYRKGSLSEGVFWRAERNPDTNEKVGDMTLTLTRVGSGLQEPTHGTLVATLKSEQGGSDVTVDCKF